MSHISFPYVFSGPFSHKVVSFCINASTLCTGSLTGEIVIWKNSPNWKPSTICATSLNLPCIGLTIVPSPMLLFKVLNTQFILVSLYTHCKLRAWDLVDGKCLNYSYDLFNENEQLEFVSSSSTGFVIVAGNTNIYVIDVIEMQKIRFFATENKILRIFAKNDEVLVADETKIHFFRLSHLESALSLVRIYERSEEKVNVAYNEKIWVMTRTNELIILRYFSEKSNNQKKTFVLKHFFGIDYLGISNEKVIVGMGVVFYVYEIEDLLHFVLESNILPKPNIYEFDFFPISPMFIEGRLYMINENSLFSYDFSIQKLENHKFSIENELLSILEYNETITSKNIFISSQILYAIGTNTGKIQIYSINNSVNHTFYHRNSEVSAIFLSKNILLTSFKDQSLSFWENFVQPGIFLHNNPLKTVEVWSSPIKIIISIDYSKRNIDFFNQMSWKSSKFNWKDLLLGQCESGSVCLISLSSKEILCYFQALKFTILKAILYLNLEYLAITCSNGNIYIFNMTVQALEREIDGEYASSYDNLEFFNENLLKNVEHFSDLLPILKFHFVDAIKKGIEVKTATIGDTHFPCLVLNLTKILKNKQKYPPQILNDICNIINGNIFKQGIFGIHKSFAFKCDSVFSKHYNSLKIASLIALEHPCEKEPCDTISLIIFALNPDSNIHSDFVKYLQITREEQAVAENVLFGKKVSRKTPKNSLKNAVSLNFSNERYHSQRIFLTIFEALAITILIGHSIASNCFTNPNLINLLQKLLKSGEPGYIYMACELLNQGKYLIKDMIKDLQLEDFTKELMLYSCKSFHSVPKSFFFKIITSLAMSDLNKFISILISELKNSEIHENYQYHIILTIEFFLNNHFLESTSILEDLGDFLLSTNDLSTRASNKDFIKGFSNVLSNFIDVFPMTKLIAEGRYLVIGLPIGCIVIYDLKSDKKWKKLKVFETTINAIGIRENFVACYSSQQSLVSVLKIETGLFKGILGQGEIKTIEKIPLQEIEPIACSYEIMLKSIKVKWTGYRTIAITRENQQEYIITLSKIN